VVCNDFKLRVNVFNMLEIQGITAQNPQTAMSRETATAENQEGHGASAFPVGISSMLAMR
jgi:hypothetical protein